MVKIKLVERLSISVLYGNFLWLLPSGNAQQGSTGMLYLSCFICLAPPSHAREGNLPGKGFAGLPGGIPAFKYRGLVPLEMPWGIRLRSQQLLREGGGFSAESAALLGSPRLSGRCWDIQILQSSWCRQSRSPAEPAPRRLRLSQFC